jgi:hypothetical protein
MAYPDANPLQRIVIEDAFIVTDDTGTHAEYRVRVALRGREWQVQRRYREFLALDEALRARYGRVLEPVAFPPKQVFSVLESVIRGRCVELQRYLHGLSTISVPVTIGGASCLVRLRELDDFLEVAQHLHVPVDPRNPLFSRPARLPEDGGGAAPFATSLSAPRTRRSRMQELLPTGSPLLLPGEAILHSEAEASMVASVSATQALALGGDAFQAATVAVVSRSIDRLLAEGSHTREHATVRRFLSDLLGRKDPAPDGALQDVRKFIEDLAAWIAHNRVEHLSMVLADAKEEARAALERMAEPVPKERGELESMEIEDTQRRESIASLASNGLRASGFRSTSSGAVHPTNSLTEMLPSLQASARTSSTGVASREAKPSSGTAEPTDSVEPVDAPMLFDGTVPHDGPPPESPPATRDEELWELEDDEVDSDTRLLRKAARLSLERAVVLPHASELLYRAQQCVGESDAVFSSRIATIRGAVGGFLPEQFEIPPRLLRAIHHPSMMESSAHLLALEQMPTPSLMANRLLLSVRCVYKALMSVLSPSLRPASAHRSAIPLPNPSAHRSAIPLPNPSAHRSAIPLPNPSAVGSVGADEFLPLFLWAVAKSDMTRPATCESFLRRLTPEPDMRGELSYYCTTLEGAVYYVSRMEIRSDSTATNSMLLRTLSGQSDRPPSILGDGTKRAVSERHPRRHLEVEQAGAAAPAKTSRNPFRTVQLIDSDLAAPSRTPVDAARTSRLKAMVPAVALGHPAFRAVDAATATQSLARAAWQTLCGAAAPGSSQTGMTVTGPTAGWLWTLHPVVPDLPSHALSVALAALPKHASYPMEAPSACLLAFSYLPLPPRHVAECSASLRTDHRGVSGSAATVSGADSDAAAKVSARVSAALGGAWADLFEPAGGDASPAPPMSTAESLQVATRFSSAEELAPFVRRLFLARADDGEWYFLPPRPTGVALTGEVTEGGWPPLSTETADWRWSGPFASLQACVVWSQTTYEGLGSSDLKRVASSDESRDLLRTLS